MQNSEQKQVSPQEALREDH